jgi:short-subunit dehydrogenase
MTQAVLIIGASGGIGSNLLELMSRSTQYTVTGWTSKDLDLNHPEQIFETDLSQYDILINCAGHNQGSWQGNLKNTWQNQLSMITVNYISNLFLLKHYAKSRTAGRYVWISTTSMDNPTPYQSVYTGTKVASKFSIDLMAKEADHIRVLDAKVGLTKTNLRFRNFEGVKSWQEVEDTYGDVKTLSALEAAQGILAGIEQNATEVLIT